MQEKLILLGFGLFFIIPLRRRPLLPFRRENAPGYCKGIATLYVRVVEISAQQACESTVTGDRLYCVDADANGQDEAVLNNYALFAYPTIEKKINEIAKSPITDGSKYFIVNGIASQCDKKCQAAINAAMDEIEAKEGYSLF